MSIPIDRLVRSRRKTVAIIIERDGKLTVRAPLLMPEARIRNFVEEHAVWIAKNRARLQSNPPVTPKRYVEGETFLYLGRSYPLSIAPRQRPALHFDGKAFRLTRSALPKAEQTFVRWYKQQAARLLAERVAFFSEKYGFQYKKIRISSARTRWGSCSSLGTLSFTYRLVMAPQEVQDYVVLHELVHTRVRNHSRSFWDSLGRLMPDYKTPRAWLKKNGNFLM
jgi:predicted metal-dependent hydrolase